MAALRLVLAAVLVLAVSAHSVRAQALPGGDQEPIVQSIEILFEGFENVSLESIYAHIRLREGQPYRQTLVDQSIRALYATGNFDFIEVRRQTLPNGNLRVAFVVVPKFRISSIRFDGNEAISDSRLTREIESQAGLPLDEVQIKRDTNKIFQFLQKRGYTNASVSYEIVRDENRGTAELVFVVDEGERLRISKVNFVGNDHVTSRVLRRQMETGKYIPIWSWITGSGRLQEEMLQDDLEKLRIYYRNQGFLDVSIPEAGVEFVFPKEGRLEIIVSIDEGARYYVGDLSVTGNTLFSDEELLGVLTLSSGDIFSPERVDFNVERLSDYYGEVGYLDTFVRVERTPDLVDNTIGLRFNITESERFYVESITLQGNTKTRSRVIIRELALAPGDVFDLVRMKRSQARLQNTRFFEEVNLSPEGTNIPNRRNLRITVREGRTGNLTFGAGFSSIESIVGFVELSQSNFDLFNRRSWFQGGGQKFRLRLSAGSRSNQILLAFEEPWLYQRELALGFELYRTETDYFSVDYNELRVGMEIYLRRRLFELVEGRLSYRLESVDIRDVMPTAPFVIRNEAGSRSVSMVGWRMLRDTRDSLVFPTSGSRLMSMTNVAGGPFLGQTDYVQQEFSAAKWWQIFETGQQTISVSGRTGTIIPYNDNQVPFFDKYFLGGPYSLRGFKYRNVGPKDAATGEPVGGQTMAMASVEYIYRIFEPLGVALFYDVGFVNSGDLNWDTKAYNDNWGFGLRILLMGAPLNLDFGFPITTDALNDDGMQFNFSFGTVF